VSAEERHCCGAGGVPAGERSPGDHETTGRSPRAGLWAVAASVASGAVASACCWVPLLLLGFGLSSAGLSTTFQKVRPLFLALCLVLLSFGFYVVYLRKEVCAPGASCAARSPKLRRLKRVAFWVGTVGVCAFAFFPNYAGLLLGREASVPTPNAADSTTVVLEIEGMTCEACAVHVQRALAAVPGVRSASVPYPDARARVAIHPTSPPSTAILIEAVEKAGYRAQVRRTRSASGETAGGSP